jgi:hypothetical protein
LGKQEKKHPIYKEWLTVYVSNSIKTNDGAVLMFKDKKR